ncbi:MAG: hypothetical protein H7A51_00460 [Akkermansiaceae bacterium]|nr:hypothetical protein [Akkermansiaceae bacterium]
MKPRYNPNHPLFNRCSPVTSSRQDQPRRPVRSSRPSIPPVAQPGTVVPAPPEPGLVLEDEISTDELNGFALCCIERLASADKDQPLERLLAQAIEEKLPCYASLKAEFQASRHQHRSQHVWTKQMVEAVEPLLKSATVPVSGLQELSDLALHSVERTMQMQYRVDQLKRRLELIGEAAVQNLLKVGQEIGFPGELVRKLAKLTRSVLDHYTPA